MTPADPSDCGLGWCLIRTLGESPAAGRLVLADDRRLYLFPVSQEVSLGMALASPKAAI